MSAAIPRAASASGARDDLSDRLARLTTLSLGDLRDEWRRLMRSEPPRLSRDMMARAVAYRIQETAFGGLSRATQRRLATFPESVEGSSRIAQPPRPRIKPGARLIREWCGRTYEV